MGSIPILGRPPGVGNGNLLQYSCLENTVDRGAWQALWGCRVRHNWAHTYSHSQQCRVSAVNFNFLKLFEVQPENIANIEGCALCWRWRKGLQPLGISLNIYILKSWVNFHWPRKVGLRKLDTITIFIGDTAYMQHYETTRCMSEYYFEQFLMSKDFFLPFSYYFQGLVLKNFSLMAHGPWLSTMDLC